MSSQRRIDVWNALLDAEMNELYWHGEAKRYSTQDRWVSLAAAVLSSGTAETLVSGLSAYPAIGKAIACVASVVTIFHANFFHSGRLKQLTTIAARWKDMAIDYRLLWGELEDEEQVDNKQWKTYETFSRLEKQIDESTFPVNNG